MGEIITTIQNELDKRYQTTFRIVVILIFSALVLIVASSFLTAYIDNSVTDTAISALWISIILLTVLSFILRRILFSWSNLQKTAEQKGSLGLLAVIQNNTVFLCLIASIIAVIGFLVTILSGNKLEAFRAGIVVLMVFLFNFPRKAIWQKIVDSLGNS